MILLVDKWQNNFCTVSFHKCNGLLVEDTHTIEDTIPNGMHKEVTMKSEHIYHLYPLGFTGANQSVNDGKQEQTLRGIIDIIPHLESLNITTLLLGPVFESETHGYDTRSYDLVDRRLGSNNDLKALVEACHQVGIKVMLDCVFNHIARSHMIFKDLQENKESSPYKDWIKGLDFHEHSPMGDDFTYECWDGHAHLVKLNLNHPSVSAYLINTALTWVEDYKIDGLRMDAADVMSKEFLKVMTNTLKGKKNNFMMLGEVVHGDYNQWLSEGGLDAVTNYEVYKGLYSSLNDENYYEIAYALNRQFGDGGIYPKTSMVNFVDNHDVNRVASQLNSEANLFPLYIMLYTMPGIPSLYYGSEFGQRGVKANGSDMKLRPEWEEICKDNQAIYKTICRLSKINQDHIAIREGGYQQVHIDHKVIGYKRQWSDQDVYVFINAKEESTYIPTPMIHGEFYDVLNDMPYTCEGGINLNSHWGSILVRV